MLLAFVLALCPYRLADIRFLLFGFALDNAEWAKPFDHSAVLWTAGADAAAFYPETFRAVELIRESGTSRFRLEGAIRQDTLAVQRIAEAAYPALLTEVGARKKVRFIDGKASLADCD